jgi:hypothetical protein
MNDSPKWIDHKGRSIDIRSMTDKWIRSIIKMFGETNPKIQEILNEKNRRIEKRKIAKLNFLNNSHERVGTFCEKCRKVVCMCK